jgi:hypothetical protein
MSRKSDLGIIWRYCERHLPGAWKFHSKWGVEGYWGTSPIVIVGDEPSDARAFGGWMAQEFYRVIRTASLANAHLMDARMTQSALSNRRHRYVFLAQLEVLQPQVLFVMDMSGYKRPRSWGAWANVQRYLVGLQYKFAIVPVQHYAYMSRCGVARWEDQFRTTLSNVGFHRAPAGRTLMSTGWFQLIRSHALK